VNCESAGLIRLRLRLRKCRKSWKKNVLGNRVNRIRTGINQPQRVQGSRPIGQIRVYGSKSCPHPVPIIATIDSHEIGSRAVQQNRLKLLPVDIELR